MSGMQGKIRAYWVGGPADGDCIILSKTLVNLGISVITGTQSHPTKRHVTPRLTKDGRWILPFYDGQIVKETNDRATGTAD